MTEFPAGWTEATLADLFETVLGGDWGKDPDLSFEDSALVRCIRASELRKWEEEKGRSAATRRLKRASIEKRRLQSGDILVEVSGGGPDQAVGRTVLITPAVLKNDSKLDFVCTNFFRFCRPIKQIQPSFLNWYLTYFYRSGGTEELQGGSNNLRNLRFPDFVSQTVPVPPVNEQCRIVEKIEAMFDEIDKSVESLQTARTTLGLYRQSLLKSAFEGRLTSDWRAQNPDKLEPPETLLARIQREREDRYKAALEEWQHSVADWRTSGERGKKPAKPQRPQDLGSEIVGGDTGDWVQLTLGKLIGEVQQGWSPKCDGNQAIGMHDWTVVKTTAVQHLRYSDSELKRLPEHFEPRPEIEIQPGDFLMTRKGPRARTGVVCFVRETRPRIMLCDTVYRFRCDELLISARLLEYALNSPETVREIDGLKAGISDSGISLNHGKIKSINVSFPLSPAEQAEIVRILDARFEAADAVEAEIDTALTRADALRQSILKKAFAGKLVSQDPTDEPASERLARIKADRAQTPKPTRKRKASA